MREVILAELIQVGELPSTVDDARWAEADRFCRNQLGNGEKWDEKANLRVEVA